MKYNQSVVLLGAFAAFLPASVSAFVTTFPYATFAPGNDVGAQIGGKDGWYVTGDSLYNPLDDRGASYSNYLNTSLGAQLGGYFIVPEPGDNTISLMHSTFEGLQYASFSVKFALQPSNEGQPGRDGFGLTFRNGDDENLLTISLTPDNTTVELDSFQVQYTVGAGSMKPAKDANGDNMFIYYNGQYTLSFAFAQNGANPTFSATVAGSNSQTFTDVATGLGSEVIESMGAVWNVIDSGNNGIIFDNVNLIPEPSTALLAGLASLGLLRRRRN
jgi:hypothetical protein